MTTPPIAPPAPSSADANPPSAPAPLAERAATPGARRIPALDAVRGIAILVVVAHNARWGIAPGDAFPVRLYAAAASAGWVGVQLFFALSGFLITGILLDTRGGERWIGRFYARRVLRIFPLYYAALGVASIALLVAGGARLSAARGGIGLGWYWSYLVNWPMAWAAGVPWLGHFWSLAVEEQFYLAWPLVVLALRPRRLAVFCVAVAVAALALRAALVAGLILPGRAGLGAAYFWTTSRCDALLLGALAAVACRAIDGATVSRLARRALAIAIAALCVLIAAHHRLPPIDALSLTIGQSLVALAAAAWVTLAALPHDARGMDRAWLRTLGKYSYAIYVLHVPIALATAPAAARALAPFGPWPRLSAQIAYTAALLGASLLGALVTWHAIERPFLALKRLVPSPVVPATRTK